MNKFNITILVLALSLIQCTSNIPPGHVQLTLKVAKKGPRAFTSPFPLAADRVLDFPPSNPLNLECFFVNVRGGGVIGTFVNTENSSEADCIGVGLTSNVVSSTTLQNSGISVVVPGGYGRQIQLIGLAGTHIAGCNNSTDLDSVFDKVTPFMYEVGTTTVDLFENTSVVLENSYATNFPPTDMVAACSQVDEKEILPITSYVGYLSKDDVPYPALYPDTHNMTLPVANQSPLAGSMASQTVPITANTLFSEPDRDTLLSHARLDLLYRVNGVTLSDWSGIEIEASLAGGDSSGTSTCETSIQTGNGVELAIYNNNSSGWHSSKLQTSGKDLQKMTLDLQNITASHFETAQSGDGFSAASRFFHLSIRERTGDSTITSPSCSSILFGSVKLQLKR